MACSAQTPQQCKSCFLKTKTENITNCFKRFPH
jgi:hypothetical protein